MPPSLQQWLLGGAIAALLVVGLSFASAIGGAIWGGLFYFVLRPGGKHGDG